MKLNKLAPWNWFKKEEETTRAMTPVHRGGELLPAGHPLLRMHREMDRLFEDFFGGFGLELPAWPALTNGGASRAVWLKPNVDIAATDKEYTINVELPGVAEKDVEVELDGDTLKIRGEKKQEKEDKGRDYYAVERSYGSFQRVLSLPEDVDEAGIRATFKNGVMTVTLPRKESARTHRKQIEVQAS